MLEISEMMDKVEVSSHDKSLRLVTEGNDEMEATSVQSLVHNTLSSEIKDKEVVSSHDN